MKKKKNKTHEVKIMDFKLQQEKKNANLAC